MIILISLMVLALFVIFCFRNFFIQLIAVKLLLDILVFILCAGRAQSQSPFNGQTTATFVGALGALIFFIVMAGGIQKFSRSANLDLEAENE